MGRGEHGGSAAGWARWLASIHSMQLGDAETCLVMAGAADLQQQRRRRRLQGASCAVHLLPLPPLRWLACWPTGLSSMTVLSCTFSPMAARASKARGLAAMSCSSRADTTWECGSGLGSCSASAAGARAMASLKRSYGGSACCGCCCAACCCSPPALPLLAARLLPLPARRREAVLPDRGRLAPNCAAALLLGPAAAPRFCSRAASLQRLAMCDRRQVGRVAAGQAAAGAAAAGNRPQAADPSACMACFTSAFLQTKCGARQGSRRFHSTWLEGPQMFGPARNERRNFDGRGAFT